MTTVTVKAAHPWEAFLAARVKAMQWMRRHQKYTDEQIAATLSMDPAQVRMILEYDDSQWGTR